MASQSQRKSSQRAAERAFKNDKLEKVKELRKSWNLQYTTWLEKMEREQPGFRKPKDLPKPLKSGWNPRYDVSRYRHNVRESFKRHNEELKRLFKKHQVHLFQQHNEKSGIRNEDQGDESPPGAG